MLKDDHTEEQDFRTQLSLEQVRLTYERTMLAWISTATSLIAFGYSIYKFTKMMRPGEAQIYFDWSHVFAFLMIGVGLLSLLFATLEYRQNFKRFANKYYPRKRSLAIIVASLIAILGIIGWILMIFQQ